MKTQRIIITLMGNEQATQGRDQAINDMFEKHITGKRDLEGVVWVLSGKFSQLTK